MPDQLPLVPFLQPVYVTSVLPDDKPEDRDTAGGAEDAKEAADGSKNVNGHESEEVGERNLPCQQIETYKEAVRKRCLHQMDFDTVGSLHTIQRETIKTQLA